MIGVVAANPGGEKGVNQVVLGREQIRAKFTIREQIIRQILEVIK
jgi:hypothetical protein